MAEFLTEKKQKENELFPWCRNPDVLEKAEVWVSKTPREDTHLVRLKVGRKKYSTHSRHSVSCLSEYMNLDRQPYQAWYRLLLILHRKVTRRKLIGVLGDKLFGHLLEVLFMFK